MSVTESKAKKAKKASPKAAAQSDVLVAALDNSPVRYTAWSRLFIGDLNCRVIPHTPEEIRGYADSIYAVGQIHNIVAPEVPPAARWMRWKPPSLSICATGGNRRRPISLVASENHKSSPH